MASGSLLSASACVVDAAERGGCNGHVDQRAQKHRADDADRQIAARVSGLLGRGRDGVEAIESEEDDRRCGHDAALHAVRFRRRRNRTA